MKAITQTQYGSPDLLRLEEVPKPSPAPNQVLIKVLAASVNGSDREALIGRPAYARISGLRKPRHRILGSDVAGRVEEVGEDIRELRHGDEVFGEIPGYHGGFAEYACAPESTLVRKPAALTFEEAAAIPQGGTIALVGIQTKGQVQQGQRVLINGAGGAAGSFAVQIAKLCGAEVTGVDHGDKAGFLHSLGADHTIDYMREDFTRNGKHYDLILDLIAHRSVFSCARALGPNGRYFVVGGAVSVLVQALLFGPWIKTITGKTVRLVVVPQDREVLASIAALCEARQVIPVIDRLYPLSEVPEALRYVGEGRHKGKVVITLQS